MLKEIIVNMDLLETRVAILKEKELVNFFIERKDERQIIGNIYIGKIVSILPGIQSSFVDIGVGKEGFLPVSGVKEDTDFWELFGEEIEETDFKQQKRNILIQNVLKKGQEILVQVSKEPIDSKGAKLTQHISLPSKYIVLFPLVNHIGISKKIESKDERIRLKQIMEKLLPSNMGVIVRTSGEGKKEDIFLKEIKSLVAKWQKIQKIFNSKKAPFCVYKENDLLHYIIRDFFTEDVKRFIIDSEKKYEEIIEEIKDITLISKIKLYKQKMSIFDAYNIEEKIKKVFCRKIDLKIGGYIAIEQTEALTAIDVNSGKYINKKGSEETSFQTNLEATIELTRQIKLRNIGGIIVIDFIDMQNEEHKNKILEKLKQEFKEDRAKVNILPFTEFGIVEITREKIGTSLEKSLCQICPCCNGNGTILSVSSICINVLKEINKIGLNEKEKEIIIKVHPIIAKRLKEGNENDTLKKLLSKFNLKITIEEEENFHPEKIMILSLKTLRKIE